MLQPQQRLIPQCVYTKQNEKNDKQQLFRILNKINKPLQQSSHFYTTFLPHNKFSSLLLQFHDSNIF